MILSDHSDLAKPQFRVLSDQQCQEIFLASLECLDRVGVLVVNDNARSLLSQAGAKIQGERVFLPPHLVQEAIASTPKSFNLWHRDGRKPLPVAPGRSYFGPGPSCTYFKDPQTGERRKSRRGDAGMTARVCDALEQIDYVMSLSIFDNVTPVLSPVYEFSEMVMNTSKPIAAWANDPATCEDIYQIACAVVGSDTELQRHPFLIYFTTYESPLQNSDHQTANIIWAAQHGLPIVYLGGPTVGLESPVTSASALVLHLATALSGVTIIQLERRGTPVAVGGVLSAMDLHTARPAYGSPEMSLNTAAACEVAAFLGIPFMGTAGASESKEVDAQAGAEIAIQILLSVLSGAGLVHDVGFLDCADIGSLELLVLADELIGMTRRIMRGIEVNHQTIMMELIEKVGPGKHYLAERDSARLSRKEIWLPRVFDRNAYAIWQKQGGHSIEDRLKNRVQSILANHQPQELHASVAKSIELILSAAEKRY